MSRFADLAKPTPGIRGVVEGQDRARLLLPSYLGREYPLRHYQKGEPFPGVGDRILIGVATWSGYDLKLLDLIRDSFDGPGGAAVCVDVFDIDVCLSEAEVREYIPGILVGHQTPFVGLWTDGEFRESAAGFLGRQLLARVFRWDPAAMDQYLFRRPGADQP